MWKDSRNTKNPSPPHTGAGPAPPSLPPLTACSSLLPNSAGLSFDLWISALIIWLVTCLFCSFNVKVSLWHGTTRSEQTHIQPAAALTGAQSPSCRCCVMDFRETGCCSLNIPRLLIIMLWVLNASESGLCRGGRTTTQTDNNRCAFD